MKLSERKCEAKQEFCEGWQGLFWNDTVSSDDNDYILYVKNIDDVDDMMYCEVKMTKNFQEKFLGNPKL